MSIIYDALQKADGQSPDPQNPGDLQPGTPEPPKEAKKRKLTKNQIMVPIVLVLSVVAVLLFMRDITLFKAKKKAQEKKPVAIILTPAPAPQAIAVSAVAPQAADVLNLEGIVYSAQDPLAMVNGKIVRNDEIVGDFRITAINPNSIEVVNTKDNTAKTITLPK